MVEENFYKDKWSAVVDTMAADDIILHMCKIKTHSEEKKGNAELYLGQVENFLSYNVEPGTWSYDEEEDLSEWVFPFKHEQVFDTKEEAEKGLIKQLFEAK